MRTDDKYNNNISAAEELKGLAPKLSSLPKEKPYEVPGYYFTVLADKALKRAEEERQVPPSIWESLRGQLFGRWAVVGTFAALVLAVTLLVPVTNTVNQTETALVELSDNDLEILLAGTEYDDAGLYLTSGGLNEMEERITFVDHSFNSDDLYMYDLEDDIMMEDFL